MRSSEAKHNFVESNQKPLKPILKTSTNAGSRDYYKRASFDFNEIRTRN
jgi:hypothetical protein